MPNACQFLYINLKKKKSIVKEECGSFDVPIITFQRDDRNVAFGSSRDTVTLIYYLSKNVLPFKTINAKARIMKPAIMFHNLNFILPSVIHNLFTEQLMTLK